MIFGSSRFGLVGVTWYYLCCKLLLRHAPEGWGTTDTSMIHLWILTFISFSDMYVHVDHSELRDDCICAQSAVRLYCLRCHVVLWLAGCGCWSLTYSVDGSGSWAGRFRCGLKKVKVLGLIKIHFDKIDRLTIPGEALELAKVQRDQTRPDRYVSKSRIVWW